MGLAIGELEVTRRRSAVETKETQTAPNEALRIGALY
jgi:hypothetical protein